MSQQAPSGQGPSAATLLQTSSTTELIALPNSALVDRDFEQDIRLKKLYAYFLPIILAIQLGVSDFVIIGHAAWGVDWKLDRWVINSWIAATVVEVIGVVVIVTKYLFPTRAR